MSSRIIPGATLPKTQPAELRWDLAFLGLLMYLLVEYTRLGAMFPTLGLLNVGKLAVGISAVGFLLSRRLGGGEQSGARAIDLGLVFFLLANFLSACFARYQESAWDGFVDLLRWVVIYFLISRTLTSRWQLRIFALLFLILNLKLAQFTIRSYFAERAFGWSEEFLAGHGVGAGSTGFFANGNDLGVAMCVAWPIAWSLFFAERKKVWRVMLLVSFLAFIGATLLCGSRGAVVGAGVTAIAALAKKPQRIAALMMALVLMIGIVLVLPRASQERMRSGWYWEQDVTASYRVMLWKAGLRMFADHPIIGVGPHGFADTRVDDYAGSDPNPKPKRSAAHSIYIEVLSEAGLLGTVPLLVVWVLLLRLNARTRKGLVFWAPAGRRSFEYCLALGLDLALVGYLVSGAFTPVFYYPHLWVILGWSVALHSACTRMAHEKGALDTPVREKFALAAHR